MTARSEIFVRSPGILAEFDQPQRGRSRHHAKFGAASDPPLKTDIRDEAYLLVIAGVSMDAALTGYWMLYRRRTCAHPPVADLAAGVIASIGTWRRCCGCPPARCCGELPDILKRRFTFCNLFGRLDKHFISFGGPDQDSRQRRYCRKLTVTQHGSPPLMYDHQGNRRTVPTASHCFRSHHASGPPTSPSGLEPQLASNLLILEASGPVRANVAPGDPRRGLKRAVPAPIRKPCRSPRQGTLDRLVAQQAGHTRA